MQGENLYDFLERQVKDQMRTALGKPLQNISTSVLNKMVTRDVQANLKKYKNAVGGRTPSRRRSASRGPDDIGSVGSPTVHFEDFTRGRSQGRRSIGAEDNVTASRQIRATLKEIDAGYADKHAILQSILNRCDEAD